jgi:hypothetical protein
MLIQGQVGQITGTDGSQPNLRQARTGELVVSQNHGRYYETASRGNMFNLTMSLSVGTVVAGNIVGAAANAATQFAIWNPLGSGFNMTILKTHIAIYSGTIVAGPVFHGVFALGNPTNATTFDSGRGAQNSLIGGRQPIVRYINTATTGTTITGGTTPLVHRPMNMQFSAGTYAALAGTPGIMDLVDGDIVIPPGYGWLPLWTGGGTSVVFSASCTWEEVPI